VLLQLPATGMTDHRGRQRSMIERHSYIVPWAYRRSTGVHSRDKSKEAGLCRRAVLIKQQFGYRFTITMAFEGADCAQACLIMPLGVARRTDELPTSFR